jgi:hypothetical protein
MSTAVLEPDDEGDPADRLEQRIADLDQRLQATTMVFEREHLLGIDLRRYAGARHRYHLVIWPLTVAYEVIVLGYVFGSFTIEAPLRVLGGALGLYLIAEVTSFLARYVSVAVLRRRGNPLASDARDLVFYVAFWGLAVLMLGLKTPVMLPGMLAVLPLLASNRIYLGDIGGPVRRNVPGLARAIVCADSWDFRELNAGRARWLIASSVESVLFAAAALLLMVRMPWVVVFVVALDLASSRIARREFDAERPGRGVVIGAAIRSAIPLMAIVWAVSGLGFLPV